MARTIAGALDLNTDLAEAVALAHDLGHLPFGHTGEDALAALMEPYGGFDHNAQALRIVTGLERHYADFDGLNLTWESLEGIAKHNGPVALPYPYALSEVNAQWNLELSSNASAEAQVAAVADDIAYNHHDIHDGLRAGLFSEADLADLPVVGPAFAQVDRLHPGLDTSRRRHEALRRVFGIMVEDVIAVAQNRLTSLQPRSADDIRGMDGAIIRFSKPLYQNLKAIKSFLFTRMYRAPSVVDERKLVTHMLNDLFPLFMSNPELCPRTGGRGDGRNRDRGARAAGAGLCRRDDGSLCHGRMGTPVPKRSARLNTSAVMRAAAAFAHCPAVYHSSNR